MLGNQDWKSSFAMLSNAEQYLAIFYYIYGSLLRRDRQILRCRHILFVLSLQSILFMRPTRFVLQLKLTYTPITLRQRLHQNGYYRCTACQKPYLSIAQATARLLWAITHIFWHLEWLKVLWSVEVTFLVGGRTTKEKVTRKMLRTRSGP